MSPRPLTRRQAELLAFVRQYTAHHSFAPTLREIAAHMGICSTNGIDAHIRALEWKGYVKRTGMKARSLVLVSRPAVEAASNADRKIAALNKRIDALQKQVARLEAGKSRAARAA